LSLNLCLRALFVNGLSIYITSMDLMPRGAAYRCGVEGIVLEAYKDNVKPPVRVWAGRHFD